MKVSVENRNIRLRKVGSNPAPLPKRFVTLGQGLFVLALWTFWAAQLFVIGAALRGVEMFCSLYSPDVNITLHPSCDYQGHISRCCQKSSPGENHCCRHISWLVKPHFSHLKMCVGWTSLVEQWIRVCPPMQWTWVQSLAWEDSTCHGATKPMCHTTEPTL